MHITFGMGTSVGADAEDTTGTVAGETASGLGSGATSEDAGASTVVVTGGVVVEVAAVDEASDAPHPVSAAVIARHAPTLPATRTRLVPHTSRTRNIGIEPPPDTTTDPIGRGWSTAAVIPHRRGSSIRDPQKTN
jgi:hypothetical protein